MNWAQRVLGASSSSAPTERRALSFQSVWGAGGDPERGTSVEASLGLPAVFACVDIIAGSVSTMPLHTFRQVGEVRERATDPPLITAPSAFWSPDEWVYVAVASMLLWGEAIGVVTGLGANGWPTGAEWVDPRTVVVTASRGRVAYTVAGEAVDPNQVVHVRSGVLLPGRLRGSSPVSLLRDTLATGLQSALYELDWFRSGAHPSSIVSVDDDDMTSAQADDIKDRVVQAARSRRPLVVKRTVDIRPYQAGPAAAGLDETRRRVSTEIANAFHVPAESVGGSNGTSLTYSNLEADQHSLDVRALQPVYTRLERGLSRFTPRPMFLKFNADVVVRTDLLVRYTAHSDAIRAGWKTQNEVRAVEDLPPIEGADVLLWPPRTVQQIPGLVPPEAVPPPGEPPKPTKPTATPMPMKPGTMPMKPGAMAKG